MPREQRRSRQESANEISVFSSTSANDIDTSDVSRSTLHVSWSRCCENQPEEMERSLLYRCSIHLYVSSNRTRRRSKSQSMHAITVHCMVSLKVTKQFVNGTRVISRKRARKQPHGTVTKAVLRRGGTCDFGSGMSTDVHASTETARKRDREREGVPGVWQRNVRACNPRMKADKGI